MGGEQTKRDITSREGGLIGDRREWNAFFQLLVQYHSIRQQGKQGKAAKAEPDSPVAIDLVDPPALVAKGVLQKVLNLASSAG